MQVFINYLKVNYEQFNNLLYFHIESKIFKLIIINHELPIDEFNYDNCYR